MTKRSAITVENLRLQARQFTWHKQELFKGRNILYGTGWAGPAPQTTVRVMPTHSVPVNAWIVHDGSGTYPATPERIAECVEKANDIFYQTGLSFHLDSVSYTNRSDWMRLGKEGNEWLGMTDLCAVTNGTHGIECYFVTEIDEAAGLNTPHGLVIERNASASVLAHEIGHACGLSDIYVSKSPTPLQVTGEACHPNTNEESGHASVDSILYFGSVFEPSGIQRASGV